MIRDVPLALAAVVLAALLLGAPLPFGSVTFGARAALEVGCAVALLLVALASQRVAHGVRTPVLALLLVAAWGVVQATPLPGAVVARLSPASAELQQDAARLVGGAVVTRLPLSLAPDLSRRNATWWAAVAAAMAAAASCGSSRRWRRLLALALLLAAIFEILYGAQAWAGGPPVVWGKTLPGGNRLRGTFVNPDHLAFFLELPLTMAFAALFWGVRRARDAASAEARVLLVGPALILWLMLFAAIAFTGSRAGLLAAVLATAAQGVAAAVRRRSWKLAPAGIGLLTLGVGTVAAIGLQQGLGRWLATSPYELTWASRRVTYGATLELWRRFPWTGTGMASFRDAFPLVQPASIPGAWFHAHNDWLEALATLGIPGAVALLVGLAALVQRLFRVLLGDNRSEDRAAALAGYGALVAAAVHSTLDFGLTIPANALALAVMAGAAAGTPVMVTTRRRRQGRSTSGASPARSAPDRDGDAGAPDPPPAAAP